MPTRDWEAHYLAGETPWDHGEPAPGLLDFLALNPDLPRGPVAVPGCGLGHDARAWAAAGFPTRGFDLAPSAVERAARLTPGGLDVTFHTVDFLSTPPPGRFDWLFEHTLYCAIDPEHRDAYALSTARWIAPGGHFLAIHYLNPSSPEGPPFPCSATEIRTRFDRWFELLGDWEPPAYAGREGRERMFWWRRRTDVPAGSPEGAGPVNSLPPRPGTC